jgi:hypothetical protein
MAIDLIVDRLTSISVYKQLLQEELEQLLVNTR